MATITFGGGITGAVGSHGGNTFAKNKGGAYMKTKAYGTNPRSELQLAQRIALAQLAKYYTNTLTQPHRAAWIAFATTFPVVNRVGNTQFLSGQQVFTKLNAQMLAMGSAINDLPPVTSAVATPATLAVTATISGLGSIPTVQTVAGPSGTDGVWFWVTGPTSQGKMYVQSSLRKLPTLYSINTTQDIITDYLNIFGFVPSGTGQQIIVMMQCVNTSTGITSPMLRANAIWS
jgi:hypothetical protein